MQRALEFGLDTFGDLSADAEGRLLSYGSVIRNVVEQAVIAEEVGVDFFGLGEHHRAEFAVSAPEVLLAAIGARTTRIRLGSAATVLSADDPVRLFQRFSTLDAITNGRAEIIVGRGWFIEAFTLFGLETKDYDQLFESKLELLVALSKKKMVTWDGVGRAPLRQQAVFPLVDGKPLKIWIAIGSTPNSVLRAARFDLPLLLAVIGGEPARFNVLIELYHRALEKLSRPEQPIGIHSSGYIADTDGQARSEYWNDYRAYRNRIGSERGWPPISHTNFAAEVEKGSLFVGSPETVARKIALTLKQLNATRFEMKFSAGALTHERMIRSITLFGEKVIPMVKDMM